MLPGMQSLKRRPELTEGNAGGTPEPTEDAPTGPALLKPGSVAR
jgi:hypothetical protein